jgi:hypothetical protein
MGLFGIINSGVTSESDLTIPVMVVVVVMMMVVVVVMSQIVSVAVAGRKESLSTLLCSSILIPCL